jgi:hypothetical protein
MASERTGFISCLVSKKREQKMVGREVSRDRLVIGVHKLLLVC